MKDLIKICAVSVLLMSAEYPSLAAQEVSQSKEVHANIPGPGAKRCSEFMNSVHAQDETGASADYARFEAWLGGYITGATDMTPLAADSAPKGAQLIVVPHYPDVKNVVQYVRKFCETHGDAFVWNAAFGFSKSLPPEK